MSELDLMYGVESDTNARAADLSTDLSERAFLDDHVITLNPSDALIAARALCAYAAVLKMAPATFLWDRKD